MASIDFVQGGEEDHMEFAYCLSIIFDHFTTNYFVY